MANVLFVFVLLYFNCVKSEYIVLLVIPRHNGGEVL